VSELAVTPRGHATFDRLALRIRRAASETQENVGSGVERYKVTMLDPFTIQQLRGTLALEAGDPDFTMGQSVRARILAGQVDVGDLVWVAYEGSGPSGPEYHALDLVNDDGDSKPVGFPPTGAAGGDLGLTYPNPKVTGLQGRGVAATAPTAGQMLASDGTTWKPTDLGKWQTWVPTWVGVPVPTVGNIPRYTVIGKTCTVQAEFIWTALTSAATPVTLSLPFAAVASGGQQHISALIEIAGSASGVMAHGAAFIGTGASVAQIFVPTSATNANLTALTAAQMTLADYVVEISGTYEIA
jgi:hypothetical protein